MNNSSYHEQASSIAQLVTEKQAAYGESPWRDIMGYALLSVVREAERKEYNKEMENQ